MQGARKYLILCQFQARINTASIPSPKEYISPQVFTRVLALLWCALRCGGDNASISLAAAVVAAVGRFATEKVPRAVAAKIALSLPLSVRLRPSVPRCAAISLKYRRRRHNIMFTRSQRPDVVRRGPAGDRGKDGSTPFVTSKSKS